MLLNTSARTLAGAVAVALAASLLGACSQTPSTDDGGPSVLVSFYPLQYLAERLAGAEAEVSSLTPPGAEPHDLELSPAQVAQIGRADLVVYLSGFQPAVDQAIAAADPDQVIDAATLVDLQPQTAEEGDDHADETEAEDGDEHDDSDGLDPHFWLDPSRMTLVATAIAEALAAIVPDDRAEIEGARDDLIADLEALDGRFAEGLADCGSRLLVTTHAAFGYLAGRYGLTQLSVVGIDPDAEPSLARIREVAAELEGQGVTTVFFESQASPETAEALAEAAGLHAEVLDPLETVADGDYIGRMDTDLATLQTALECS